MRRQAKDLLLANEEIKTINENLEGIVIKRTQLLEESNKELDTFLYRASHDLRSPIRSILGLFSIIEHIPQAELVKRVQMTTMGMDHMIRKLINISEINQASSIAIAPYNVSRGIHDARNKQGKLIYDSGMTFKIDCPEDIVIETKPALVEAILTNLIENAIYYSLLKDSQKAIVEVKAVLKSDIIEITVYDNGVGIDEATLPKLFTMFFVGHEKAQGNGLGLYIVQKCVQALSGKTFVESRLGSFTKFTIVLPLYKA
jgi:signal transduction histidine kinase